MRELLPSGNGRVSVSGAKLAAGAASAATGFQSGQREAAGQNNSVRSVPVVSVTLESQTLSPLAVLFPKYLRLYRGSKWARAIAHNTWSAVAKIRGSERASGLDRPKSGHAVSGNRAGYKPRMIG
jgi:hypothetical protein